MEYRDATSVLIRNLEMLLEQHREALLDHKRAIEMLNEKVKQLEKMVKEQ